MIEYLKIGWLDCLEVKRGLYIPIVSIFTKAFRSLTIILLPQIAIQILTVYNYIFFISGNLWMKVGLFEGHRLYNFLGRYIGPIGWGSSANYKQSNQQILCQLSRSRMKDNKITKDWLIGLPRVGRDTFRVQLYLSWQTNSDHWLLYFFHKWLF